MEVFDKEKSKIKMVILTKGKHQNKVWFSPIKYNKRKSEIIIGKMLKSFEKSKYLAITNVVQFYENNVLISKIRY
jgi:hypothetical protein